MGRRRAGLLRRRCALEESSQTVRRYYSNRLARLYLTAIEDIVGSNGVAAVLRLAGLGHLIGNYPPDTMDSELPFEDLAAINESIAEMYGLQGAKGLCLRAGRAALRSAVTDSGLMADLPDPAFKLLPLGAKVKVGLNTLADVLSKLSDQEARLEERAGGLFLVVEQCPECWGRVSEEPVCFGTAGMVHEAVLWLTGEQGFRVTETNCVARGDDTCTFLISRELEHEAAEQHLEQTESDAPEASRVAHGPGRLPGGEGTCQVEELDV
jgi:predicted hydrocarbon binding protein